uniref:Uncharacterized protein n=1 Tax=Anguilla anguilla TaxID=7936 RepID=A0A0E9PCW5_ANGAN
MHESLNLSIRLAFFHQISLFPSD